MKRTIAKIIGITIIAVLFMQTSFVVAVTEEDELKNQQSQINDQIKEAEQKQKELEATKSSTLKTVEDLIGKISTSESEVDTLENQVTELQNQIKSKENDIKEKEEEYTKQEQLLDARVVAMYESGETSYLDVLLTSKSITDFLAKYYYASELVDCDKQLIQTTKDQKTQIEAEKAELEASKRELDTTLAQAEQKNVELKSLKKEKETYVQQLSEEEKKVQKEIEELEEANKQIQKEITAARIRYQKQLAELKRQQEAKKNNNKNNNNNSSNGGSTTGSGYFIRPVSSGTVTTNGYYSTGKFHGAIDYGVASGTTVMAAADGVVMSTANLSGSYGTYVVIEHANGLQTYYAHGTKGSITVKPGDIVKQGQKIMLSGSTGNSTGPHLHFEVRKSPYNYSYSATAYGQDSRVNPLNYL